MDRNKIIVRTSIIGILTNVFLASFKAIVGLFSNSIAVILDAVNNLSDAVSSIVTIIGAKLANRKPDKKHPLGHGRIEYISALVVAAIVIYAGITSGVESVKKMIHPEKAEYEIVSLLIIAVAVVVKIVLGTYVKKQGKKVKSGALVASGTDALFDAIVSTSVLICALISFFTGFGLEPYVGLIIAGFIIKAGIEMMLETLDLILGRRADPEVTKQIKSVICEIPQVRGAFDLMLNNYGPDKNYASVHIELPDTMSVEEVDCLTREIEKKVTGVGVYSFNTKDDKAAEIRNGISELVMANEWALQMHGFYVNLEEKSMRFDVVFSFDITQKEGLEILYKAVSAEFPDFTVYITPDVDLSD